MDAKNYIYITSDEKIKEPDWIYFYSESLGWPAKIYKCLGFDTNGYVIVYDDMSVDITSCKKITASTNPELKLPLPW
jgi:hypothetical protein